MGTLFIENEEVAATGDRSNFCTMGFRVLRSKNTLHANLYYNDIAAEPICRKAKGYQVGMVFVYNNAALKFANVRVNGKEPLIAAKGPASVDYIAFDLSSLGLHMVDLSTVEFIPKAA